MFFTDHGEYLGDHRLIEKWTSGLPEDKIVSAMTEMVDLAPTILELSIKLPLTKLGIPSPFVEMVVAQLKVAPRWGIFKLSRANL